MPSSIFGGKSGNSVLNAAVGRFKSLGDPNVAFQRMYQSDPNFRQFADSMAGKTPEQAFAEHGLDFGQFRGIRRQPHQR